MKVLIICATRYGSTNQIGRWMKERYNYEGLEVLLINPNEAVSIEEYDLIVMGSGIYGHDILPELREFIEKNLPLLTSKKTALFGVLMKTEPIFYKGKIHGGIEHMRKYISMLGSSLVHLEMLHGELVPSKLSDKDREKVTAFYKSINLSESELKARARPRTLMSKKEAWDFVEKTLSV